MKQGEIIDGFTPPPHPRGITLSGHLVRLEPLHADTHAESLYSANALDSAGDNWTYLPYGPFEDAASYTDWVETQAGGDDPVFFAIIRLSDARPVGVASYLRIHPDDASIEVGHIHFSPLLQQTTGATEIRCITRDKKNIHSVSGKALRLISYNPPSCQGWGGVAS